MPAGVSEIKKTVIVCAVAILALLPAVSASGCRPTPAPPATGRIAFFSNRDWTYEIYVMDADGSNQTRLTNNPAVDWTPAWSP